MITTKGQRAAMKPSNITDGQVFDSSVNIKPCKVELVTEIKPSNGKSKMLGAIVLFPDVAKNEVTGEMEGRKHWISFDNLFTTSKELFDKFYDNATCEFVGLAHVGVKDGRVFLANA